MRYGELRRVSPPGQSEDPNLVSYFLENGGGDNNWGVDGSTTPQVFSGGVPSGRSAFRVHRALLYILDGSGMRAERFASLTGAITNGCDFELVSDGVTNDMLSGEPIKMNADFGRLNFDVDLKSWGAGDEVLLARWSFNKFGGPLVLRGSDVLRWRVNDDLLGVTVGNIALQGTVD